jgi:ribosomal protein L37E
MNRHTRRRRDVVSQGRVATVNKESLLLRRRDVVSQGRVATVNKELPRRPLRLQGPVAVDKEPPRRCRRGAPELDRVSPAARMVRTASRAPIPQTKGTQSFGMRHNKTHTLCRRCNHRAFHIQKQTCGYCGYPAAKTRSCECWCCPARAGGVAGRRGRRGGPGAAARLGGRHARRPGVAPRPARPRRWRRARWRASCGLARGARSGELARSHSADNWSMKSQRRRATGTGRMRHLKDMPRRFKNHFQSGAAVAQKKA